MYAFEEHPSNNIKSEVCRRDLRCTREVGESFWGIKVKEKFKGCARRTKVYNIEK
jgi:hypothetical protein